MLAVIWWMYDAFIWLTNAMPPSTHPRRAFLLLGMIGFLVVSLTGDPRGFVDAALAARGLGRRVALIVPRFHMALAVVATPSLMRCRDSRHSASKRRSATKPSISFFTRIGRMPIDS